MSKSDLTSLEIKQLQPTRDYLQDMALMLGSLQRAFLPVHPRDWHYGLEVNVRGIVTQPFIINGQAAQASLDLVKSKLRLGNNNWRLSEHTAPEMLNNVQKWLVDQASAAHLEQPKLSETGHFDDAQAHAYAKALWWMDVRFRQLKANLAEGVTSPILLYAHHFDLSLVWFPYDDERQLGLGFSTGDKTIAEPYIYLTAYPEPADFTTIELPAEAHWQTSGFSGAILPFAALQTSQKPEKLFERFAAHSLTAARKLF